MSKEFPLLEQLPFPMTDGFRELLEESYSMAYDLCNEFVTPEHVVMAFFGNSQLDHILSSFGVDTSHYAERMSYYIDELDSYDEDSDEKPEPSMQFHQMLHICCTIAASSGRNLLSVPHLVKAILLLPESMARFILLEAIDDDEAGFMSMLITNCDMLNDFNIAINNDNEEKNSPQHREWHDLVVCLNDICHTRNKLIGRDEEIEKTLHVLCRKDKNNPLHIGEPGVGKTALVYGLASRIEEGNIPEQLKNCRIYQLDIGSLLAGTQFRGDFEKKLKLIMDGASQEGNAIIYIDEIHNLIGAGATSDSSMDASNMLKPYLERGDIRFIGSTTYEEYKRHFERSKGITRRFTRIDVPEPDIQDALKILYGLKENYQDFHKVVYSDDALESAVKGSAKYMHDRFLPDKAIDLIDQAGAYRQLHPLRGKIQKVDKKLISELLAKLCRIETTDLLESDNDNLETLGARMLSRIFGQDLAVKETSEAILMAKAGINDDTKPMASLLFVGPTGVGKTEVAKVLADELNLPLVRFDMSEYTEKHSVAKLIGAPAGYVGYDDGGILTDSIRKTPNCVLLLDEIEKAHQDIYNILLQVMDYGKLTDNKGNKTDFRNVIIIMTSNAGAQFASHAKVGFANSIGTGDAMLKQVKKVFKPEFINRLSGIVVFNDMTTEMATLILDKKISELQRSLKAKNVTLKLNKKAKDFLLSKGYTKEYGARELDRAIASHLKPLLMREILFGKLKKGGVAKISAKQEELVLNV